MGTHVRLDWPAWMRCNMGWGNTPREGHVCLIPPIFHAALRPAAHRGWVLDSPMHCAHGHQLGRGGALVGWDNRVPAPALCWTCRQCGHVTWAHDPNRDLRDTSRRDQRRHE